MLDEILLSHSLLVKLFLGFLVGGLVMLLIGSKDPLKLKRTSFIYTLIFQGIITMIAFAGLVAMVVGKFGMGLDIILMVLIWGVLMYIEIRRHKLIKFANLQNEETYRMLKVLFVKIITIQIALVTAMVVFKILQAKGVISF
ncbi:MAG: hypothetical protein IE885_01095 [Campylobacterales bacterium]|nr:hypothetical protein [Campylobacterales bacterium]